MPLYNPEQFGYQLNTPLTGAIGTPGNVSAYKPVSDTSGIKKTITNNQPSPDNFQSWFDNYMNNIGGGPAVPPPGSSPQTDPSNWKLITTANGQTIQQYVGGGQYYTGPGSEAARIEELRRNLMTGQGLFGAGEYESIRKAGESAAAQYDPLIMEAEKSKAQGMGKSLVAGGQAGGLMNTQFAGAAALRAGQDWAGPGGILENVKSAYDLNIANLQAQKMAARNQAERAMEEYIRTGKSEDFANAQENFKLIQEAQKQQAEAQAAKVKGILDAYKEYQILNKPILEASEQMQEDALDMINEAPSAFLDIDYNDIYSGNINMNEITRRYVNSDEYKQKILGKGGELLSPSEAKMLGVSYGTTRQEAFGRIPGDDGDTEGVTDFRAGGTYKTETLEDIQKLPVSDLTKSVMAGYGKLKDLTPTDRAKVQTELYQTGFNPYTYVNKKLSSLVNMWESIPDKWKGIFQGRIPLAGSINPNVAEFESAKNILTREIARLNDVGVLSDQDVASYTASMPARSDRNISVVKAKLRGIKAATGGKGFQEGTINIKGRDIPIGSIITNSKGQRGRVEANGTITLIQ